MQLKKERAVTLHRRMWRWIGLKTLKEKRCVEKYDWFDKFGLEIICVECYCCEYVTQFSALHCDANMPRCRFCPIDWGGTTCLHSAQGVFGRWNCARIKGNWQEAGKLALQIAELPERNDYIVR